MASSTAETVLERQLREACAELGRRIRAGEDCGAERLFADYPEVACHADSALELIYTEFVIREQLGQQPSPEQWYSRFPAWRQDLEQIFQVHRFVCPDIRTGADVVSRTPFPDLPTADWPAGPDPNPDVRPRHFGSYELIEEISRGGMGVVYKARQRGLNRIVALKMILAGDFASSEELARFRREAEAAASLQHPNIVQVYEVGVHDGRPYFSLEYVDGGNLQQRLAEAPLPVRQAAQLVETLARAVHYAHERGIIHRDLKPANILLAVDSRQQTVVSRKSENDKKPSALLATGYCLPSTVYFPKITDFGLAKHLAQGQTEKTRTGAILGTPSYMAPEQAGGKASEVGTAADVYALGAIFYECLTSRPPFRAANILETLDQVRSQEPVPPRRLQPNVPSDLETICLKCLRKEPQHRYGSARQLAEDLKRFLNGEPILARQSGGWERLMKWTRRRPAVASLLAAVLLVSLIGVAGIAWQWRSAVQGRSEAEAALAGQEEQRKAAETNLFHRNIALAHREWQANDPGRADQLLDECPPDQRHWEWYYLKNLCHSELARFVGHTQIITGIALSRDGRWLASIGGKWGTDETGEVFLWDWRSRTRRFVLKGHQNPVLGIAFSPDGKWLASSAVSFGGRKPDGVRIWDVATGKQMRCLEATGNNVFGVAFSADGKQLATAHSDGGIRLWDSATGKLLREMPERHRDNAFKVAFSRDGDRLASISRDGTARIWNLSGNQGPLILDGEMDLRSVDFSPDGKKLATGSWANVVSIWDTVTGKRLQVFSGHSSPVGCVSFSSDGQGIASADSGGNVKIWNAHTAKESLSIHAHANGVGGLAFSTDGKLLVTGGIDRAVKVWDTTVDQEACALRGTRWSGSAYVSFSPDGRYLACAGARTTDGWDPTVYVWDMGSPGRPRRFSGFQNWVSAVAISPTGRFLAASSEEKTTRIWDLNTGKLVHILRGHNLGVTSLAWQPGDASLATAGKDGKVVRWNPADGRQIDVLDAGNHIVNSVTFSPDGQELATGIDGIVRIWDLSIKQIKLDLQWMPLASDRGHLPATTYRKHSVVYHPDGRRIATCGGDSLIRIWDLRRDMHDPEPAVPERVLAGHAGEVWCLSFSHDGRRLASGSADRTVRIWDVESGQEILTLRKHPSGVNSVAFSPDGQLLVSSSDSELRVWEAPNRPKTSDERLREALAKDPQKDAAEPSEPDCQELVRNAWSAAEEGKFDQANADSARALDLGADIAVVDGAGWQLSRLRLFFADEQEHQRHCAVMCDQHKESQVSRTLFIIAHHRAYRSWGDPHPELAIEWVRRALQLAPRATYLHDTLGKALYRAGDYKAAIAEHLKAEELGDKNGAFFSGRYFGLAMAHWRLGEKAKAREWFNRALEWKRENQAKLDGEASIRFEIHHSHTESASLLGLPVPAPLFTLTAPPRH
jgi:WD40 repeat protein/serine/threonine protein kinase